MSCSQLLLLVRLEQDWMWISGRMGGRMLSDFQKTFPFPVIETEFRHIENGLNFLTHSSENVSVDALESGFSCTIF